MKAGLRIRLYAYSLVDELGPINAVYPLWFAAQGLSLADISLVYVVWAATVLVLEVPTGALADRVDRRILVAIALLLRAVGIGSWLVFPHFWGICFGAVLFAAHEALCSGSFEALVYDELSAAGREDEYAQVSARMGQFNYIGIATATGSAALLLSWGVGLNVLGWLTILSHLPPLIIVLSLPHSRPSELEGLSFSSWWNTLREGVRLVSRETRIARLVVLGCLLEGLFILDEYVHLLGVQRGAKEEWIPWLVGAMWLGLLAGGELSARRPGLSSRRLGGLLAGGILLGGLGLVSGTIGGIAALALTYAALNASWIRADARLQASLEEGTRATATSVRSLSSSFVSMIGLGLVGLVSIGDDPTRGVVLLLLPLLLAAWLMKAWAD